MEGVRVSRGTKSQHEAKRFSEVSSDPVSDWKERKTIGDKEENK
jgi:hypothetical protein